MIATILLAHEHTMLREGIAAVISRQSDLKLIGQATTGREAVDLARKLSPDIVAIDIFISQLNGMEATRRILRRDPKIRVVAISGVEERLSVARMLAVGATGYLLKSACFDEFLRAIRAALDGKRYLSPALAATELDSAEHLGSQPSSPCESLTSREREVLQWVAEGKQTREIANGLHIADYTVNVHRRNILQKLNLRNVAELTRFAIRERLIHA